MTRGRCGGQSCGRSLPFSSREAAWTLKCSLATEFSSSKTSLTLSPEERIVTFTRYLPFVSRNSELRQPFKYDSFDHPKQSSSLSNLAATSTSSGVPGKQSRQNPELYFAMSNTWATLPSGIAWGERGSSEPAHLIGIVLEKT